MLNNNIRSLLSTGVSKKEVIGMVNKGTSDPSLLPVPPNPSLRVLPY